ncbi:MAG TPA: DUF5916 domain-containing protein [Burkholderiaceae bacterium]
MSPIRAVHAAVAAAWIALAAWPLAAAAEVGAQAEARAVQPAPEAALSPLTGHVDPITSDPLAMHAVRLLPDEHIVLDGTLSNPAWQRAPVYDNFVENEPHRDAKPRYATKVQILFDEQALYVGVTSLDDHPEEIRAPLVRQDKVIRTQDFVVVYIDAIGKRQSAQFFRVNASGSTGDGMHTAADDDEDFSPDFDFDAASARTSSGYTSVFRIPFASLRFSSDSHAHWRIMVARRMPRDQAYMWTSVKVPTDAPAFISAMQPLEGIELPQQKNFLTIRPSITARHTSDTEPGQARHTADGVQGSLDVKWRASPELVIDGTLKPDFSQVALDVPQLSGNTDFALYLPEKRPFFFESSDLLHSPTEAMYTRSFTAPRWGVRSTWRGASLAGTAFVIDDKGGGETLLPYGYGTNTALQPGSRSLSARGLFDVNDDGRFEVGGILAARRYEGERGDNTVAGPDVNWQLNDAWRIKAQWLRSQTTAQPFTDPAGDVSLVKGPATTGDSVFLKVMRYTDRTQLEISDLDISPQFRHDTGFVNQVGVRDIEFHPSMVFRDLAPINEMWLNLRGSLVRDRINGDVIQESLAPDVWVSLPHNTQAWISWHGLSRLRATAGGRLLTEHYWKGEYTSTLAQSIPLFDATVSLGRMADVTAGVVRPGGQVNLMLSTRPFAAIEIEPSVWAAWLRNGPLLAYRETASQLLGVWHIDARQNLRLIVQRSTVDRKPEAGVAADRESGLTTSLTYAFRKSMGTVMYVGATRSHSGVGAQNIARGTEAFVKLQVDVDEVRGMFGH